MRGQFAVLPALEAGRCACVVPRLAFNIVLAGEVGLQADFHGHGHGPASARRADQLSRGTDHPSPGSTAVYAKVSLATLREVARGDGEEL